MTRLALLLVHLTSAEPFMQVFEHYQKLLNSENYVTRRQSLKVAHICSSFCILTTYSHIVLLVSSHFLLYHKPSNPTVPSHYPSYTLTLPPPVPSPYSLLYPHITLTLPSPVPSPYPLLSSHPHTLPTLLPSSFLENCSLIDTTLPS